MSLIFNSEYAMQIKKYTAYDIRRLRLALNLRQSDLAHIMGVSLDSIWRLEKNYIYTSHARLAVYAICITLEDLIKKNT